jgi:Kef-type K+ transport system membrane component KefB
MSTTLGIFTLTAAATDDAMARCLLVLVVALAHSPQGSFNALYVFLTMVGFVLFMYFAVRPFLVWLVDRSSRELVASQTNTMVMFIILFASAFFTQALGLSALFGAFLVGLITRTFFLIQPTNTDLQSASQKSLKTWSQSYYCLCISHILV